MRGKVGVVVLGLLAVVASSLMAPAPARAEERADGFQFLKSVDNEWFNMTERAEPLGFHIGGSPDPSGCKHYQAIVRVNGADGTPFFLMTRSGVLPSVPGPDDIVCDDSDGERSDGNLIVFKMASRSKDGERMRSNRLVKGTHSDATEPPNEDRATIFYTVVENGLVLGNGGDEHPPEVYQHPGGLALVGHMLAMACESPRPTIPFLNPDYVSAEHKTLVQFFDVSDPEHPVWKSSMTTENEMGSVTGTIGVTPMPDGHYLMVATGGDHNDFFYWYRSDGTDLSAEGLTWTYVSRTHGPDVEDAHQTLTFFRQDDINGTLMLGGVRGKIAHDRDARDLYQVNCQTKNCLPGEGIFLTTRLNARRIVPFATIGGLAKQASGAAASGFYITPSGELLMYITEHDNDGPDGTVKLGEWHHKDLAHLDSVNFRPRILLHDPYVVDEGSTATLTAFAAPPIVKPWIALYTQTDNEGLYPMIDFEDWFKDDYDDLGHLDLIPFPGSPTMDDTTKSWAYYAPVGCSIDVLDFEGHRQKTLAGTGFPQHDLDLTTVLNDDGDGNMNEKVDGVRFEESCSTYYETPTLLSWDTDRNGTFETPGTQAPFSAAGLDGPSTVDIPLLAQHAFGGRQTTAFAEVTVRNVPPRVGIVILADAAGRVVGGTVSAVIVGMPVKADALFSDPGLPDHQTAGLAWGDGVVDTQAAFTLFDQAFGDGAGRATHSHRYTAPGIYSIALTVTDDDGGAGTSNASLRVLTPAQATQEVIDAINQLIAASADFKVKKALDKALKALAGNPIGSNGALQKINTNQKAAAIASLQQAIDGLAAARDAGTDTSNLIALLQAVVAALQSP
ncbi:MAG TPA: PKD domain-containing protein [Candidatus Polarisedimenticolia bacterium]|nr:PKD domain-containing protein [Candidatus Polarisedimenticolia bacterium]